MNPYLNKDQIEVGIDEAGRGVFLVFMLEQLFKPQDSSIIPPYTITDSKKITKRRRKILKDFIEENAVAYSTAYATEEEVMR